MYIAINLKNMTCMYKHRSLPTVCKLAMLSGNTVPTLQINFKDYKAYSNLKHKQLENLFSSISGKRVKIKNKEFLIYSLVKAIGHIEENKIDFFKLEYQVRKLKRKDIRVMTYCDGFDNKILKNIENLPKLKSKNHKIEKYSKEFLKTEQYFKIKKNFSSDEIKKEICKYKRNKQSISKRDVIWKICEILYLKNGKPKSEEKIEGIKEQVREAAEPLKFKLPTINSILVDWREEMEKSHETTNAV